MVPIAVESTLEERRFSLVGFDMDVALFVRLFDRQQIRLIRPGAEFARCLSGAVLRKLSLGDDLCGCRIPHGRGRRRGGTEREGRAWQGSV